MSTNNLISSKSLTFQESCDLVQEVKSEVMKVIIGQERVIELFIIGVISNGHILIEGAPGLAKTMLVRALSIILDCRFKRVQFTPDLLPSDILGINMFDQQNNSFHVEKGPIFTNLLLADEINRASSKVQSALLEGMAEREVTIGSQNLKLNKPFLVFATENPVESLGTYALPQAQLDRFLLKIEIDYPTSLEEEDIIDLSLSDNFKKESELKRLFTPEAILVTQNYVKEIYLDNTLKKFIVKIIDATRYPKKYNLKLGEYIEWGVGPRGTIGLILAAKANAFFMKRNYVIDSDIFDVAFEVLRHRLLLNYEGQAKKIKPEHIVAEILSVIKIH